MTKIDWHNDQIGEIVNLMEYIDVLAHMGMFERIDLIFANIDLTSSSEMMVSLLRMVMPYRSVLPSWKSTRDKIYDELISRGKDADKILIGLLDK